MSLISVSIVTFNTWLETERCVEAVLASRLSATDRIEVLIHDNGDEPPQQDFGALADERVRVMRSARNMGFAAGHNCNLALAQGDRFLVLNPDTQPAPDALAVLAGKLGRNGQLGAVAPQLLNEDGSIQPSCRRFPRPLYEVFRAFGLDRLSFYPFSMPLMADWDHASERVVDQPAAAALMMRSADLRRLGGFDEEFPMYFEDVDLCRRVTESVGPVLFTPDARVRHVREGTAARFRKETTFWLEWSRTVYFSRLNLSPAAKLAVRALGLYTAFVRMILLAVRGLIDASDPRSRDARAKALGYGLALSTLVFRDESHWRRTLLHP